LDASNEALQAFDQIILEYHYGYKNLEKRLKEAGFKVEHTKPKYFYNTDAENKNMYLGLIFCEF
jgi:recombination DNA repair RAD52 pathway protein